MNECDGKSVCIPIAILCAAAVLPRTMETRDQPGNTRKCGRRAKRTTETRKGAVAGVRITRVTRQIRAYECTDLFLRGMMGWRADRWARLLSMACHWTLTASVCLTCGLDPRKNSNSIEEKFREGRRQTETQQTAHAHPIPSSVCFWTVGTGARGSEATERRIGASAKNAQTGEDVEGDDTHARLMSAVY